jgi:hypothetical protein
MAQAVRRQPVTSEAQVRARISPCEVCVEQSDTGTGFSLSPSVPLSMSFHCGSPLSCIIWGVSSMIICGRNSGT